MNSEKNKLSTVHKVTDTVKVDPREEYVNVSDRMQVIHYKRLVVPANMRSIYWKCYGFPASEHNEILTKTKIVCLLCKTQITYNRNTSNLRMHLRNKHKQELETLELVQPLPHSKAGTTDKRTTKKTRLPLLKQEAVVQVFPISEQEDQTSEQCFSTSGRLKSGRKCKEPNRYGEWVVQDGTTSHEAFSPPEITATNSQFITDVEDINPLRVIMKDATSSQAYTLVDGKIIADAIADFIMLDLQSPEVVEGKGFQRLLATLRSPCEIPSKTRLSVDIIPRMYESVKELLVSIVSGLKCDITLSVEDWISNNGDVYSTICIHYISDSDNELQSRMISTLYCSDLDPQVWAIQFDSMLEEWDLQFQYLKLAVVSSNRKEVHDCLNMRKFTIIPCFSHSLQEACTKAVFEVPAVAEVLHKCRALIALVNRHSTALSSLRLQENLMQGEDIDFTPDVSTSWLSTFNMVEQVACRKTIIPVVLESLGSSLGLTRTLQLTEEQWVLLEDIVTVLSPFKVTVVTLAEEKSPHISILKPILWQLLHVHLQKIESDSTDITEFKQALTTILTEKYKNPKVNKLLDLATVLDPRFKNLPFMNEKDKPALQNELQDLLLEQIAQNQSEDMKQQNMAKKQRLSGMEILLGELCMTKTGMPVKQRADVEMVQYDCEESAPLEKSPIEAWRELRGKCRDLSLLATRYLSAPACVLDSLAACFQPPPPVATLPAPLAHKVKFLHRNYTLIGNSPE